MNAPVFPSGRGIYAVQLWPADPQQPGRLRGRLEHVFSGRCHDFADAASLLACLLQEQQQALPTAADRAGP